MEGLNYVRGLLRSWWLILLVLVAGGVGGYVVYHRATPMYASTITISVANDASKADEVSARQLTMLRAQTLAEVAGTGPALEAAVGAAGGKRGGALGVTASSSNFFVVVRVVDTDPRVAHDIAAQYPAILPASLDTVAGQSGTPFSLNVVTPAVVAGSPYSPDRNRDVGLGLAAGLIIGLALAVLREALNRSVRHSEDAHDVTGLPILGTVPRLTPKVALPALEDPRSARAEAYRQVRTTLLSRVDTRPLTVAVTSATLGEGKTSVACNLAVVLSRAGHNVVLVDADMRRPRVSEFFGLPNDVGLSDVLNRTSPVAQAMTVVDEGRLSIMPSGRTPGNPAELLGSERMTALIAELGRSAEFVVIDTPPVLPVTDARELAAVVDGIILVVKLGGPSRERVRRAVSALERVRAEMIGLVPNQAGRDVDRDYRYSYRYKATRRRGTRRAPTPARGGVVPTVTDVAPRRTSIEEIMTPVAEDPPTSGPAQPWSRPDEAAERED